MWQGHGVTPREANEAVEDEEAVWVDPDPKSRSGCGVRVIGYSLSAGNVLTVILLKLNEGWVGANGWKSNSTDQKIYKEA